MKIVWDEPKRRLNLERHGLDFADLSFDFFSSAMVYPAKSGRFVAIGELDGRLMSPWFFLFWDQRRFR